MGSGHCELGDVTVQLVVSKNTVHVSHATLVDTASGNAVAVALTAQTADLPLPLAHVATPVVAAFPTGPSLVLSCAVIVCV